MRPRPAASAGMLLCHAGPHRLAFPAQEVAAIDVARAQRGARGSARRAFGEPAGASRVLVAASGEAVGVDTLEIDAEPRPVLPRAAGAGARVAGGSLQGFILVRGELWPLVRLVDFEHFLASARREAA